MRITQWPVVAGAALFVAIGFLAVGAQAGTSSSGRQGEIYGSLTDDGRRLWHFEALLRREFPGRRAVFVSEPGLNFSCVGRRCNPHARYRVWSYTFRAPRSTAYHVSRKMLKGVVFGNFVWWFAFEATLLLAMSRSSGSSSPGPTRSSANLSASRPRGRSDRRFWSSRRGRPPRRRRS